MQLPAGASFQVPTMAQVMPRCGYLNPKTPNYLYCSYTFMIWEVSPITIPRTIWERKMSSCEKQARKFKHQRKGTMVCRVHCMLDKLHGRLLLRHGRTARNGRYKDYEPKHKILGSVLGHLWFRDYNFRVLCCYIQVTKTPPAFSRSRPCSPVRLLSLDQRAHPPPARWWH